MQIKILFDDIALNNRYLTGWGFSCLIDNSILFDTGENEDCLFANMKKMNVDILKIKAVVISHDHWDHTRGLWGLLRKNKDIVVYSCPGFDGSFRKNVEMLNAKIIESKKSHQIIKNIYTTGQIYARYKDSYTPEQALVIKTARGVGIITGCSHPGIIRILDKVKSQFPRENIYIVIGGFHLLQDTTASIRKIVSGFKKRGVKKVGPAHCAGRDASLLFKEAYKKDFVDIKAGQIIEV